MRKLSACFLIVCLLGVFASPAHGGGYEAPATNITGNAATATALAANGTNCSAANFPLGVDASGNSESCTALSSFNLSTFAATTSAQLSGVLSDETGSGGGFARATSPTLATPAITGSLSIGSAAFTPLSELEISSELTTTPRGIISSQHSDTTDSGRVGSYKSRGTRASPTTVATGDFLGRWSSFGYDGANYLESGSFVCAAEGTVASTRVPSYCAIFTSTDAAPSVLTERIRIDSAGRAMVGVTATTAKFDVRVAGLAGIVSIGTNTAFPQLLVGNAADTPTGFVSLNQTGTIGYAAANGLSIRSYSSASIVGGNGYNLGGSALRILIDSSGRVALGGVSTPSQQLVLPSAGILGWDNAGTADLLLGRDAAATLQMGADAATPTAQTLKSADGSGTDKAGGDLTIAGGNGTGTGLGGAILFNTTPASTTGSTQNTSVTRARFMPNGHFRLAELAADPSAADLTSGANAKDRLAVYMKSDKIVFAYNNAGTVTYVTLALDGSATTWVHSTSAP